MKRFWWTLIIKLFLVVSAYGQWLPPERQAAERKLWATTGVEFPAGLQFYELPIVSQRLVGIVNYRHVDRYGIFDEKYRGKDNVNAQYPWVTPAGLHWSPKDQWRKVAGAVFPSKVKVYRETIQVENSITNPRTGKKFTQPQPHIAWAFAEGTVFAEMLIKTDGATEHVFEIRHRQKLANFWHGTTYRPDVDSQLGWVVELPPGKLADFGFEDSNIDLHAPKRPIKPGVLFKATRTILRGDFLPKNYYGHVRSCNDCHGQAGKPTSYGATTIRGSDGVLSWHPFSMETVNSDAMPKLDQRWPLTE